MQQRQYDPFRELWKSLVNRVYNTDTGYEGLSTTERLYYSVGVLEGDVYNGGMYQFFANSGSMFQDVVDGLLELRAHHSLTLLLRAKDILFAQTDPPSDPEERDRAIMQYPEDQSEPTPDWAVELEKVDKAYWNDPDKLNDRLRAFAESQGLVDPFLRPTDLGDKSEHATDD